jgi:hypothetical protein
MAEPASPQVASQEHTAASRRQALHAARQSRRHSQRLLLGIALAVSLLLLLAVSVMAGFEIDRLSAENGALARELFEARQKLERLEPELKKAREELAHLTRGRLPHLKELIPDTVIPVNTGYVKNIVFTVLRQNGQTRYEYRAVLENMSDSLLRPEVRVFVFDQRGVQVGSGDISDRAEMIPGESRSYSAIVERFMDEEPRYFYVWVRARKPGR